MDTFMVYKITCLVNDKIYIGYTKQTLTERFRGHKKSSKHKNTKLYNAFNKHGIENFTIEKLFQTHDKNEATDKEIELISEYNTTHIGYNITSGGDGGSTTAGNVLTDEHKKKISESLKGRTFTKEHKTRISENHHDVNGENNPFYGKTHTEETKKKIGSREYSKGEKHHFYGKTTKTSFKEGKDHPRSQQVMIDGIEYGSLTQASKLLGMSRETIKKRYLP